MYKLFLEYRLSKLNKKLVIMQDQLNKLEEFHYYVGMDPTNYENQKFELKKQKQKIKRKIKIINIKLEKISSGQRLA